MKRFVKGCLIVVVSLVIAGVVLLCVAAGGGVNRATLRNLGNQHALRFGSYYLYLDGPLSWHVVGPHHSSDAVYEGNDLDDLDDLNDLEDLHEAGHHSSGNVNDTTHYEFDTDSVKSIDMDLSGAEVKVFPSKSEKIEIDIKTYGYAKHEVNMAGDTLNIYYDITDHMLIGFEHRGREVVVYLPKDYQAVNYNFDIDASDVEIDVELYAQNISMNVDAGELDCSGSVQTEQLLELDVDAGSLSLDRVLSMGDMTAACDAGDLEVDGESYGNITADVDAGDAEFDLRGEQGVKYKYILKGNLSDMKVNGQSFDGMETDLTLNGDKGAPTIALSCDVGSLEFTLR